MLLGREDLSQMAAKLLPKWEGHPRGKHQPAKDLCMSNSSSGQVSQPGGFVCLSWQPSKCRGPQESRQRPLSPLGLVLGMLEVEKWDGDSWGPSSSSVEQTGRVMSHRGFTSPLPADSSSAFVLCYLPVGIDGMC